jgi:hypothetical protein
MCLLMRHQRNKVPDFEDQSLNPVTQKLKGVVQRTGDQIARSLNGSMSSRLFFLGFHFIVVR